ncbi:glycosyltransferase family 39 protein [Candidatus Gottesmanbacteria bacterium]|nr:glycosyltransferase family 39 protein [Candidatus Gottesmanbacteria bacterium]
MKLFKQLLTINRSIIILEIILLLIFLFWRFQLGLTRYFDVDEFAYLHWGYNVSIGEHPYVDFFYLLPPFFLYLIAGVFNIFGRTVTAIVEVRVLIFLIFLATTLVLFLLGKKMKGGKTGLLAAVIFAFLPLPADKMLEIRPDLLATLLALTGLYLYILAEEKTKAKYYFLSGACYSLSLGFLPKTVFFLIPPLTVLAYKSLKSVKLLRRDGGFFLLGFLLPVVFLILLIFSLGNPFFAIYSMTQVASKIINALGSRFYMRPDIFFYPNDTYYGLPGYSAPLLINLVIYIAGSVWAILKAIQSLSYKDKKKCLREFLLASCFFLNLFAFVYIYPLKHAQYLVTIAPFIAIYFADLMETITESRLLKPFKMLKLDIFVVLLTLFLLGLVGKQIYEKKIQWNNQPTFDKVSNLLKVIPAGSPVFDLTGESIFFPDGYYFCCLPYGQFEQVLLFSLPDLEKEIQKRKTKFVYTGWFDRLNDIPARQAKYIKDNFTAYFPDGSLLIKK